MTSAKNIPPMSWQPSEYWDGDDGAWSSLDLRIGKPEQTVRVLPSTAGRTTWAVLDQGCQPPSSACSNSRGGLFNLNGTTSRSELGDFTLQLEQNFGHNESGVYGLDTVALGLSNATGSPALDSQVVVGIETNQYRIGLFGLSNQPQNITNFTATYPTFLSTLKARNMIPSLSWAYTAGAPYRSKGFFGSLNFGGTDVSRYTPNNVTFHLAPDISRDIVVGVQSVIATYSNGSSQPLLPTPLLAFVDSTIPYIYLPVEACQAFEKEFGLVWNSTENLYPIDQSLHQTLLSSNPTFKFSLGNDQTSTPTVDIALPYASFDLTAQPPLLPNPTLYFPLRRAINESQYTLGRVFLQESYLATNYEFNNFSISQSVFDDAASPNLVALPSNDTVLESRQDDTRRKLATGTAVGVGMFLIIVAAAIILVFRSRRKRSRTTDSQPAIPQLLQDPEIPIPETQEIGHNSLNGSPLELQDAGRAELLDHHMQTGSGNVMNELPQVDPSTELEEVVLRSSILPQSRHAQDRGSLSASSLANTRSRRSVSIVAVVALDEADLSTESVDQTLPINKPLPSTPNATMATRTETTSSLHHPSEHPSTIDTAITEIMQSLRHPNRSHSNAQQRKITGLSTSRNSTPISESLQVSPLMFHDGRTFFPSEGFHACPNREESIRSTYATIFDYDDYRDLSPDKGNTSDIFHHHEDE